MFNINKTNQDDDPQLVIVFDYDGVITKIGTSGLNEAKWLEREKSFFWRNLLNIISYFYNKFVPFDENIREVMQQLRENNCKIIIVSSHLLTTNNYPESEKTRNRIIERLNKENIVYDEIYFKSGNKVEICKELGAHLAIEDTTYKIKALRKNEIPTVARINKKNIRELINDPDAIYNSLEILPIVATLKENFELINRTNNIINITKNNKNYSYRFERGSSIFGSLTLLNKEELETAIMEPVMKKRLVPNHKKY